MNQQYLIIESNSYHGGYDITRQRGEKSIAFTLIRDARGRELPIPLRSIPHGRLPPEFDQFRRRHGIYIIVDAYSDIPLYVGESHTARLIHTATRHVQNWNLGPTWDREDMLFALLACNDAESAYNLQNLIIAEFILSGVELANGRLQGDPRRLHRQRSADVLVSGHRQRGDRRILDHRRSGTKAARSRRHAIRRSAA